MFRSYWAVSLITHTQTAYSYTQDANIPNSDMMTFTNYSIDCLHLYFNGNNTQNKTLPAPEANLASLILGRKPDDKTNLAFN